TFSSQIYIAILVYRHAIRAHFCKQGFISKLTIFSYVIPIGFISTDICYIQLFAIRSAYNAIWLLQVFIYPEQGFSIGREIIDMFTILFHFGVSFPVWSLIQRIRKKNPTIRRYPKIIGPIKSLALIIMHQ